MVGVVAEAGEDIEMFVEFVFGSDGPGEGSFFAAGWRGITEDFGI